MNLNVRVTVNPLIVLPVLLALCVIYVIIWGPIDVWAAIWIIIVSVIAGIRQNK